MYETYYHLKTKPFTLLPDPEFIFLGAKHKMALSLLEYGLVNGSAFIVITGEPGTGKTTLLNRLLDQSRRQWTIGLLENTHGGLGGLMPWITASFGLATKGRNEVELFHEFARFLEGEQAAGRRVLMVLDEAQNVGSGMLEELRLLSNLNDGRRRSLQILLSGQPALRDLLKGPGMEQFAQRIAVEYALEPLIEEEVITYIGHRVRVAGGQRPLFSTLACRKIFALAGGVPRLINLLCDHALVYGYAAQVDVITARVALDAARARDRNGFLPFRADPASIEPGQNERDEETAELSTSPPVASDQNASSKTTTVGRAAVDPAVSYREALALKQAGEFSRAIVLLDRLAADEVWGIKALGQIGLCLKAIGRYEEALSAYRAALDRPSGSEKDLVSLRYVYARTLESMGRSKEAVECYRMIGRDGRHYRDVAVRIDQLQSPSAVETEALTTSQTWLQTLVRNCTQLLRSTS
ncbi:MAG TPA: AAA family ATPase [Nitrospiraceae bacterium]|nr:AAA family ATPase [Nitrospiraceae bacterium]